MVYERVRFAKKHILCYYTTQLKGDIMRKLEEKQINDLFFSCLFEEDELIDGRPTTEFTSIESIAPNYKGKCPTIGFSTNKLNEKKQIIIDFIDALPKINEGSIWEDLYYDCLGNKWCEDIKTLDQLVMMALACGLISHTIIEGNGDKISIITRTKENDKSLVKGSNPELLPQNKNNEIIKQGYTLEELKLIAENKSKITEELNQYIEIIKTGFKFLGINVILNKENVNQLDFFNNENKLIFSKKFEDTDGILGIDGILNQRLRTEFMDSIGNEITYLCDGDRHIFSLSSEANNYGYRVEITQPINQKPSRILISTTDANSNYIIKRIEVDGYDLLVELNNQFGPYGNYEDGEKRYLWYRNPKLSKGQNNLLYMIEDEWYEKGHHLSSDGSEITIDGKKIISGLTHDQFYVLSTLIACHPRNRELIIYTMDELDKQLSGVKQYVSDNFILYNVLSNENSYESNPLVETIIQSTIHEKCNINNNSIRKTKKGDSKH